MFSNLSDKLISLGRKVTGNNRLTESNIQDAIRDIRIALLEADVSLDIVKEFIEEISSNVIGQHVLTHLTPGQAFIDLVHKQLINLMGEKSSDLSLNCAPPAVIMVLGLQGSGKTTTVAKIANLIKTTKKKKVLLVSADFYRPAAIEQLNILAKSISIDCYNSIENEGLQYTNTLKEKNFNGNRTDLAKEIVEKAINYSKRYGFDVIIIDTAGRLTIDEAMMQEIQMINNAIKPIESLLVADSMLGQESVNIAKAFNQAVTITGVVLTKMDGDGRGGCALSIKKAIDKPIKFIGTSEKISGLERFYPDRIASRILGMGDILSLIDQAKKDIDTKEAKKILDKAAKGKKFDLNDFKKQCQQIKQMGGLSKISEKLPAQIASSLPMIINDKMIKKYTAIIDSLTKKERSNPEIIKSSQKKRAALGSGMQVQDVNQMLKQFEQIQSGMKQFGQLGLSGMMKKLGSMFNNM